MIVGPAPHDTTQIPPEWVFHPDGERRVTDRCFTNGSPYVGSRSMVPAPNDHYVLELAGDTWMLGNAGGELRLISNICAHMKGLIVDPANRKEDRRGNGSRLSCPMHRWAYALDGSLTHHPNYSTEEIAAKPSRPCLPTRALTEWQGLAFLSDSQLTNALAEIPDDVVADLPGATLGLVKVDTYDRFGWVRFMDNYQEITHVSPFHLTSFAQIVDTSSGVRWVFGDRWSVQYAPWRSGPSSRISLEYRAYRDLITELVPGSPGHGAIWAAIYPNLMIERYPLATVVSSLWPLPGNRCRNVMEYYIPKWVSDLGPETLADVLKVQQKAYDLTAREDGELCDSTEAGRRMLFESGVPVIDHPHPELDAGMLHFRAWLHRQM